MTIQPPVCRQEVLRLSGLSGREEHRVELGYTSRGTAYNIVAKAIREQTAEAVGDLRDLENTRLDALQHALWDAAMAGNVRAVTVIVKIVQARVHLNGLEPARDGFGTTSAPQTVVVPPTS